MKAIFKCVLLISVLLSTSTVTAGTCTVTAGTCEENARSCSTTCKVSGIGLAIFGKALSGAAPAAAKACQESCDASEQKCLVHEEAREARAQEIETFKKLEALGAKKAQADSVAARYLAIGHCEDAPPTEKVVVCTPVIEAGEVQGELLVGALWYRAHGYALLKDVPAMLRDLERIFELSPGARSRRENYLGVFYAKADEGAKALPYLDGWVEQESNNSVPLIYSCATRASLRVQLERALLDCQRAFPLAKDRHRAFAKSSLCHVLYRMDRLADALAACTEAIALDEADDNSRDLVPIYLRGVIHKRLGNNALADNDFKTAREEDGLEFALMEKRRYFD